MTTRRQFLQGAASATALAAAGYSPLGALPRVAPLRILILGGTGYLGPHLVHVASRRGHRISILNRGRREIGLFEDDFKNVEAIQGDRATPTAYDNLKGKTWDVVIETSGYRLPWTQEAARALRGAAGRYLYVSSTGVFHPYHTANINEDGRVLLQDTPPLEQPSYGVMKALSENAVKEAFGAGAIIVRPGYIVGPGDTSDRFTYWPMRVLRGGEILVPGKRSDPVQYVDVRDLAEFMITLLETSANGTYNVTGPAYRQTMEEFVYGVGAISVAPRSWTWVDDYAFLRSYPLRRSQTGQTSGYVYSVPWIIPEGDDLGHMQIDNRKAIAAGLKFRPLAVTALDLAAWRSSSEVPQALRDQPRYVLNAEQEAAILKAWKDRR